MTGPERSWNGHESAGRFRHFALHRQHLSAAVTCVAAGLNLSSD